MMRGLVRGIGSGFGRTFGRFLFYFLIGFLAFILIKKLGINLNDFIDLKRYLI